MRGARVRTRTRPATWIALSVIAAAFLYITANSYALELGAAHHDAFCPEHGWAVSPA